MGKNAMQWPPSPKFSRIPRIPTASPPAANSKLKPIVSGYNSFSAFMQDVVHAALVIFGIAAILSLSGCAGPVYVRNFPNLGPPSETGNPRGLIVYEAWEKYGPSAIE